MSKFAAATSSVAGTGYCVQNPADVACTQTQKAVCVFNGSAVPEGSSVVAFQNSSAPGGCVSQRRACANGILSGSFVFASCSTSGVASCLFNGQMIAPGDQVTAFLSPLPDADGRCASESRVCRDGRLSGSMGYSVCAAGTARACSFDGRTVEHGASVTAYSTSTVPSGQTCEPRVRTCYDGALSGAGSYASCVVGGAASCLFNGETVADGQRVNAYLNSTVPSGKTCVSESRLCVNGELTGRATFAHCGVDAPNSCEVSGRTIADGEAIVLFKSPRADGTGVCNAETRVCRDGILSGRATELECQDPAADLTSPFARLSAIWFVPNQIAGDTWNKPNGQPINGHLEGSFSDMTLWPVLQKHLRDNSGGLGTFGSEIGYLSNATLTGLRRARLPVQVEVPGFTQCQDGSALAKAELLGPAPDEANLICVIFGVCGGSDRHDPKLGGWLYTREGHAFNPEELVLDERMPNLLPAYNMQLDSPLFQRGLSWEERKRAAYQDPCPRADTEFNVGTDRITGLIGDYVEYARVLKARSPATDLSLHWNVNAGWEKQDFACLEAVNARHSDAVDFRDTILQLKEPCHGDTNVLKRLVKALCDDGECPKVIYMDIDYTYNTGYALSVLRLNKALLRDLHVEFGINLVNQCAGTMNSAANEADGATRLACVERPGTPNAVNEEAMLNVVDFLSNQGIIDASTRVRMVSWTARPIETGDRVSERVVNSAAWTANRIFTEYLIPRGLAN